MSERREPELAARLARLDGRPYGHYKDLRGTWPLGAFRLVVHHVQGDPFAAPSRIEVELPPGCVVWPDAALASRVARRAAADFLHRSVSKALGAAARVSGSGKSGRLEIATLGPEVLERTAVSVDEDGAVGIRLCAGLPAAGRRILGKQAERQLLRELPAAVERALETLRGESLGAHVRAVEDQVALRAALEPAGLVAFLAEGAVLPRRSGVDPAPLADALPLEVPDALAVELDCPHAGKLRGWAIERGVSAIVGGGYHGKSTLLAAIALGIYDHVPGDGRERCVTRADCVAVRAEDGRSVRGVDLRPFISGLPLGRPTDRFDTDDASGSTSQAAAIVEALEVGAGALLVDEDTAATNFMIRDARMRRLVRADEEPITPFIDRVRQLFEEHGVSSVLVVGGAGDYLDVADRVIQMCDYQPRDVGDEARRIARELPLGDAAPRSPSAWPEAAPRVPDPASLDPARGRRRARVRARSRARSHAVEFGHDEIDLHSQSQLVDPAQVRAIGDALRALGERFVDGAKAVPELLGELAAEPLERRAEPGAGDRAAVRVFEVAAALNRLRSLRLREPSADPLPEGPQRRSERSW